MRLGCLLAIVVAAGAAHADSESVVLVIGGATYITLTLPALAGYYLVDEDPTGTAVSLSALACGCLADGAMVAMLFEYFHRRVGTRPRPAVLATSSAPSRASGVVGAERAAASGRR